MADLPDVEVTVQDGGLGILPASNAKQQVKIGVCSAGVPETLYAFNDLGTLQAQLGKGPLVEAAAVQLSIAGGPVYCMPITPTDEGEASTVTHVGTGAASMTVTEAPADDIVIACTTGGTLGTAAFTFTLGDNETPDPIVSAAGWSSGGFLIPGTLTTWVATSGTYSTSDVYTVHNDSATITHTAGAGPAVGASSSSPLDEFDVIVTIVTDGAPGTGAFKYSLDGGNSLSAKIAIPGSGVYALTGAGMFVTFASSAVTGDTYSFTTTTAGYSSQEVTDAFTALLALSQSWSIVHLVGQAEDASGAATIASTVDTEMGLAFEQFRFVRAIVECPSATETDTEIADAFEDFASDRVCVCAGDASIVSPISGRHNRRNAAWVVSARAAAVNPGRDVAAVADGPLRTVASLYHDEVSAGGILDGARFSTLRTFIGKQGYFITNGKLMAAQGSDFSYLVYGRVIDQACTIARNALLPYLNGDFRVDTVTGFIDERDASRIEKSVNAQLKAGVVDTGDATSAVIQISRTENIISTAHMPVTCAVIPKAYARKIPLLVGFSNPALSA